MSIPVAEASQAQIYVTSAVKLLDQAGGPASPVASALAGIGNALLAIHSETEAAAHTTASTHADIIEVLTCIGAEVTDLASYTGDLAAPRPSWWVRALGRWVR